MIMGMVEDGVLYAKTVVLKMVVLKMVWVVVILEACV